MPAARSVAATAGLRMGMRGGRQAQRPCTSPRRLASSARPPRRPPDRRADGISRLRADLVTVGIDPGRTPFEHRSRAHGVAIFLLTNEFVNVLIF